LSVNHPYWERELLPLVAEGDERAFSRLYYQTNAGLYNAVMTYVKDPDAAREIVQQVYIKLWDSRRLLKDVRSLKDYLFILARNTVFDHMKKHTVEMKCLAELRTQAAVSDNNVISAMQERECGNLLHHVVSRLPVQQRKAFLMASEQEMSYDKIAVRMRVSKFTVKRHLELARRHVRQRIHHYFFGS
jgi:RNA polymerase sigma-70 factor (ECF subfamily)